MTDSALSRAENISSRTLNAQQEKNTQFKAKQRGEETQSFDTVFSKTIQHNEIDEKAYSSTLTHMQQEIMKLIVMTRYQMNSSFFDAFCESNAEDDSAYDSVNWMVDMGTGYGIDLSTSKNQRPSTPSGSSLPSAELDHIINQSSDACDVDPALIKVIIQAESNFDPNNTSPKGAMGLMQLMPETPKSWV